MIAAVLFAISSVTIHVHESAASGKVVYAYRITNRTHQAITRVRIGYDAKRDESELTAFPPGWTFAKGLRRGTATVPAGWSVRLVTTEENPKFMLEWTRERSTVSPSTLRVTLRKRAPDYRSPHYEVTLADGTRVTGVAVDP